MKIPKTLLILAIVAGPACADSLDPWLGDWRADVTFNDQQGSFALHFERGTDGALNAAGSLPPIDLWHLPLGELAPEDGTIEILGEPFKLSPDGEVLSGFLPAAVVPVHRIEVELRRGTVNPPAADGDQRALPENRPRWTAQVGAPVYADPVIIDGEVLVLTDAGCAVFLQRHTGAELRRSCHQGSLRATPALVDDDFVLLSDAGVLRRLTADGDVRWATTVAKPMQRAELGYHHYTGSPAVAGERVWVATHDGELLSLDIETGDVTLRRPLEAPSFGTPGLANDLVVVGDDSGVIHALGPDGSERWRYDTGAAVVSRPALTNEAVIIGSRSYDLFALDLDSGKPRWRFYFWYSWVESSAVVLDEVLYIGSSDAQLLRAIDVGTGRERWVFDSGGSAWASPAVSQRFVAVAAVGVPDYNVDHRASLTLLNRDSGQPLWQYRPPPGDSQWGFAAAPLLLERDVIAATLSGSVMAFPVEAGGGREPTMP